MDPPLGDVSRVIKGNAKELSRPTHITNHMKVDKSVNCGNLVYTVYDAQDADSVAGAEIPSYMYKYSGRFYFRGNYDDSSLLGSRQIE